MGKNLNTGDLVKRSEGNLAFYGVPASTGTSVTFTRMEGFTDLSNSKNPSEYNRRYVDEDSDRTTNTGFAPEKSYTFDRYKGNTVHDDIIAIHDNGVPKSVEKPVETVEKKSIEVVADIDGVKYSGTLSKRDEN